ncbi:MAG: SusC/RagA family TonB-linked outer membrane protein, partial [Bacteroidota bacterium]
MERAMIAQVIEAIESQSEFRFLFDRAQVDLERKVDVKVKSKRIGHILKIMFNGSDIDYTVEDRQISLNKKEALEETKASNSIGLQNEYQITGTVTDQNGSPLPGASLVVVGTTTGTQSDFDGNFEITVPDGGVLEVSYVGFTTQQFTITQDQNLQIQLQESSSSLDEVVVVGYGTKSQRFVSGSISKVDVSQIENTPNTNVAQALRGRVAGVQFTSNGRPGQGGNILIRGTRSLSGSNDPLIVLDGIFFNGDLADINPNDIESIEVLKDASSTAIYGSRASNGVILITSKKGDRGKPTIRFNTFYAFQNSSNDLKLLSPERYIKKTLDFREQTGQEADPANILNYLEAPEAISFSNGTTIDPYEIVRQTSSIQSYDLSISGRNENVSYFVSGSLVDERGLRFNDNSKRIALRTNLETKVTDWMDFGVNAFYSERDNSGDNAGSAYRLSPYAQIFLEDGSLNINPVDDQLVGNPLFGASRNIDEEVFSNLFANLYANIDIPFVKGLSYRINYSPNIRWERHYEFEPKNWLK